MSGISCPESVLASFRYALRSPAYRQILQETNIDPNDICDMNDFSRVPFLDKHNTFARFHISQLCVDGTVGPLASVLTSSGHSGVFAFGLYNPESSQRAENQIDDVLDRLLHVRTRSTLLLNCLPMGVKVYTKACTLGEVSVRADMAIALVDTFAKEFDQVLMVGDAAFIKQVMELGQSKGIDWKALRLHIVLGEEPLAENARKYFEYHTGVPVGNPEEGLIFSSMGIGEIGLNLFFEVPPVNIIIRLRRLLHENEQIRQLILGERRNNMPCLFTYDPSRIYVEFTEEDRLVLTTLDTSLRVPLIRYIPGDYGRLLKISNDSLQMLKPWGIDPENHLEHMPLVIMEGRGKYAETSNGRILPEEVKEGLYFDPSLASQITANFRLISGKDHILIRIQMSPGNSPSESLNDLFSQAISKYVSASFQIRTEEYWAFQDGMALDYERKFDYFAKK